VRDFLCCALCLPAHPDSPAAGRQAGAAFAERLDQGHDASCPWLGNACDPSVAQFPPLARPAALAGFKERLQALAGLDVLPPVAPAAYAVVERSHRRRVADQIAGCRGTARKASRCAEGAAAHLFAAVLLQNWRLLGDWRPTKSASRGLMCSCQEPSVHSAGRVCSSCWSTALQRSNPSGLDRAWAMVAPHVAKQPKTVPWAPTAHVPPRPPPRTALSRTRAPMLRSSAWPVRCLLARLIHPDTPSSG